MIPVKTRNYIFPTIFFRKLHHSNLGKPATIHIDFSLFHIWCIYFHVAKQEQPTETSSKAKQKSSRLSETNKQQHDQTPSDYRVKQLKDQLIQAKVFLSLPAVKSNPHLTRELRLRVKDVSRTLGDASKDSELPGK